MSKKQKRPHPTGTKALRDHCLMLHGVLMDGQNDPNSERRFPDIEALAKRFELTIRTLKRYPKYMRESLNLPVAHSFPRWAGLHAEGC